MNIGNSCNGCVFSQIGLDGDQHGCELKILDEIRKESNIFNLVDGYYQFDRICPIRSTTPKTKLEIYQDSFIRFHFIIIDKDVNKTIQTLDHIYPLIRKNNRVAIATTENFKAIKEHIGDKPNYFITNSFEDKDAFGLMDECFHKMKNGYTIVLESGEVVTENDLDDINKFVNWKMKRLALVNNSPFVVNNVIYKMLKGNKHMSFKDKLDEMCEEQTVKSMTYTWEEIHETISG
jgi:hypothetical protein